MDKKSRKEHKSNLTAIRNLNKKEMPNKATRKAAIATELHAEKKASGGKLSKLAKNSIKSQY